jgi:hypothetical protein
VFVRAAWEHIEPIESLTGKAMGQGSVIADPKDELLELLTAAYEGAADHAPEWDGRTFYISFGEGPNRNWEDARRFGFVGAGGGAWYSKTLRAVPVGSRVCVYIPKGNGVGGYVGVGDVTGPPAMARDFKFRAKDGTAAHARIYAQDPPRRLPGRGLTTGGRRSLATAAAPGTLAA